MPTTDDPTDEPTDEQPECANCGFSNLTVTVYRYDVPLCCHCSVETSLSDYDSPPKVDL